MKPLLLVLSMLLLVCAAHASWFGLSSNHDELAMHGRELMSSSDDMASIAKSIKRTAFKKFTSTSPAWDGHVPGYGELCPEDPNTSLTPEACWKTYGMFLLVVATVGIILGILALGGCVVFFGCIRYPCCCKCLGTCGSRVPSKGICFVQPKRFTGYKPREVSVFKYLLIGVGVCVILLLIPLWVGEGLYLRGMSVSEAKAQAKNVTDSIESALPPVYYSELSVLEPTFRSNIAEFYYYTRQFSDLMPVLSKTVKIVVNASSIPFWTITIGMLFVAIAAILVAFLPSVRLMLYPVAMTSLLWCGLFFFIFGWYFAFGIAASDTCKYAADSVKQDQPTSLLEAIDDYCIATYSNATGGSIAEDILNQLNTLTSTVATLQCIISNPDPTQSGEYFPCVNPGYVDCTGTPLPNCQYPSIVGFHDVLGGPLLTTAQCAVSCTNVTLHRFANNLLTIDAFSRNASALVAVISPLLYCSFYLDKIEKIRSSSCRDLMAGCVLILITSPIIASFAFALFVVAIMAVKRLNVDNQIIEASGMEMRTSGGTASARDSTKVEKEKEKPSKPKLEPEIARTMREREVAASAVAASATKAPAPAESPESPAKPAAAPVAAVAPMAVSYPDPSPPESRRHSDASDSWAKPAPTATAAIVAPAAVVSEPPPAYEPPARKEEPVVWHSPPATFVDEPAPLVVAPAAIAPTGASPSGSQVSRSRSGSASSGSGSASGSGSGSASSRSASASRSSSVSASASASASRSASVSSNLGAPPRSEAPPPPYEP